MKKIVQYALLLTTIFIIGCTNVSTKKENNPNEIRNYNVSKSKMMDIVVSSIKSLGYKIDSIDKENGLLNFESGISMKSWAGQSLSIYVEETSTNTVSVYISGVRKQSSIKQLYDWGEAKGIAKKVFEEIETRIN